MASKSPSRREREGSLWDLKEIEELIALLTERQIAEFEMEKAGMRIRIRRGSGGEGFMTAALPVSASPLAAPPTHGKTAPAEASTEESTEGLYIVKSPIVGTFYAATAPNAPAFVKLGDTVQVGQVLCIIEAMKLMNEIESEVAGEVVRIYAENGQPVEYGQSLFAIKPSLKK
jgi:acetyl-CoA carboxylase biotin carboxyl carrier protein